MAGNFRYSKKYVGPLQAAILDWSGTTADKYVLAPAMTFVKIFLQFGVPISMPEARGPMGLRKDLHIKAICELPEVRQRWFQKHGKYPDQSDVKAMYDAFVPTVLDTLPSHGDLIPGCAEAINTLRQTYNMKIGCTTGFTKVMSDVLLKAAEKQGYVPDSNVAGDEVLHGTRPRPFMLYRNLDLLDVHPIQAVVKVDDTTSGIFEAQEAGCWSVGVARYSNYMNINSFEEEATLSNLEIEERLQKTKDILWKAGAHYVVDSIADLPSVCQDINRRLAQGEYP
ncbi:hypothetical protein CAPTEDRAFT_203694 [Capitella teleta]|uniref:Phosphonoacetaldehyde hydrolase n=1 Tax=Capitella teleta TaxID=283909 RepID=R7TXH6_CAPTE|nr:hypothetical protein CAPTEDRAFT_185315 [Capitella teleta]ELT98429.1 hypothetical protein CAPTEDRAFT_203694 [Capitella teleta]|eukprot:ELT97510.1 hypothetical protein CAPTEDRAFT_185315 [Capitella teleta]